MKIRPMELRDIQTIVEMGAHAHAESEFRTLEYSPDRCFALAQAVMSNDSLMCYVVEQNESDKDKLIAGFIIAGVLAGSWFTEDKTSDDLIIYVAPGYRGSRAFYMMYVAYVSWAKTKGAKLIFLRNRTGYEPEKVGELYQRLGFRRVGGTYVMEG